MNLVGRRVVVTGGGRGIGRAYVERSLAAGARVAVLDLDMESANKTVSELGERGEVIAVRTDVANPDLVKASVAEVVDRFGGLDVLVNNAAIFGELSREDESYDYLRKIFDVNLLSLWLMTREAAPHLIRSEHGRIINQSSTIAYNFGYKGPTEEFAGLRSFSYGWTKFGVNGLTKYSAAQLGHWGVTVNAIAPGPTHTEAFTRTVGQTYAERLVSLQPIKGAIRPEDIAGTAVFLASDDARFITGQVIVIDGGRTIPA